MSVSTTEMSKDKADVEEFIASLEDYQPTIPDEVATYYLNRTGFVCSDVKMKRLVSLAAQNFISNIAFDALQYCKIRQNANKSKSAKDKRLVLTMEDLSQSLKEYGINLKKPEYYADKLSAGLDVTPTNTRTAQKNKNPPTTAREKPEKRARIEKDKDAESNKDDKKE
eukprot:TRINITY_DN2878_c0_g1_i1.p1 TRINITY_DN2878_c0_g1~~TRINITY_DN2878_c0_g1_i1.p1  ORF type:complete len:168 (-),score=52.00 TRINITY_DN2878_c0_g1_i1:107-610(-)